jgi:FolB domain-containing protein
MTSKRNVTVKDGKEAWTIHIRGLRTKCIIGTQPKERRRKQRVVMDIAFTADLHQASRSDAIADAVDYKVVKDHILEHVSASRYELLESLAASIADIVLEHGARSVDVSVDKPGALTGARSVGVRLQRGQA